MDRKIYKNKMQEKLQNYPNLTIFENSVEDLIIEEGIIKGIITEKGEKIQSKAVIITTGTFLKGVIHMGTNVREPAGRIGDKPSIGLSNTLYGNNFKMGRLRNISNFT
jgi:tRNA uridine 5-carboxymethylaminomethyl modification enzyme